MNRLKTGDVLADPEIRRHTRRILALQQEERETREKLGRIVAEIGAELLAVKEALDKLSDKTAWLRWLKSHVHYTAKTAQNYMSVARLAKKTKALSFFSDLDPTALYRIAALPDGVVAKLGPDTLLTDPRTGRQAPLREMSGRQLDRALDALEGRTGAGPATAKRYGGPADLELAGATREEFAADALRVMERLSDQLAEIRGRKGRLTGDSKQAVLNAIERLRRVVLKWPAWARPVASQRSR